MLDDNTIKYDEFRSFIMNEFGVPTSQEEILFVRARKGNIEFHCPVFVEELKEDAKEILRLEIERFERLHH